MCVPFSFTTQVSFASKVTINATTGAQPYALDSGSIDSDEFTDVILGTGFGNTL